MWELGIFHHRRRQTPCQAFGRTLFHVLVVAQIRRSLAIQDFVGEILSFRLTGGKQPTLAEINGGKLCVDAWGKQPPSYAAHGSFDLAQCATIANEVPHSIGFRWGSHSFDVQTYNLYAGRNAPDTPIDLSELFYGENPLAVSEHKYTCAIYMGTNETSNVAYHFEATSSSREFGFVPTDIDDGPGIEVCFQRWTLLEFFRIEITELWFCYMKDENWKYCEEQNDVYVMTGALFYIGLFVAVAVISFTLPSIPECSMTLLWLARLLLNWELGLLSIHYLLGHGFERDLYRFMGVGVLTTVVLSTLILLPYHLAECVRKANAFGLFYLMVICLSPTVIFEHVLAYERRFPMMIYYQPTIIGAVGFLVEIAKHCCFQFMCGTKDNSYEELGSARNYDMAVAESESSLPASSRRSP